MSVCSSFAYTEDSQSEAGPHVSTVWIDDKPAHVGTPWWYSWVEAHVLTTWAPAFLQQPCGLSMQTSDFRVLRAKRGDWSLHSVSQRQLCGKKHTWCFRSHADIYNGLKWINKGHEGLTDVMRINCSFLLTFLGISMFLSFKGSFGESSLPFPLLATLLRFFSALIFSFFFNFGKSTDSLRKTEAYWKLNELLFSFQNQLHFLCFFFPKCVHSGTSLIIPQWKAALETHPASFTSSPRPPNFPSLHINLRK